MESELKTIENFWSSMVTEDGLATYLSSTFKVSPNDEVKALALLTRVTFLMSVGMKNDRDDSVRNEKYLLNEIIKIGKNCPSHNICCQKTKLALDYLVKNFKQCGLAMTSMSHDVTSENLTLTHRTNSHENVEFFFNKQNMEKSSLDSKLNQPDKILAPETQKSDACLLRKNVCAIPETMVIENSQYGSDTIFEKTPNKGFGRILEQCKEDFSICTARKIGDDNWEEEMGTIDDASLSPILKKQTVQHIANKSFISTLDTHIDRNNSLNKCTTGSVSIAASDIPISSTAKFIDPHAKRSLDFTKSPGYKLNIGNLNSNMNELISNKIGNQDSKLLTLNQDNLNSRQVSSKCLTPKAISNSPSLLTCKSLLPQMIIPPQLVTKKESFESSKKLSTLMVTPGKLSNLGPKNFVSSTESPKQNLNVSISEVSRSSSDVVRSLSLNLVDEHVPSKLVNVEHICSPGPKKKLSSLCRHKSSSCTLPISKKARVTPLPRTRTACHSSKIKAEVSFISTPKRMLRQTTLTKDCFLRKANEIKAPNDSRKKLYLLDKDDSILNADIEKSLKTKLLEDTLNDTVKVNLAAPVEITSSDKFEKDLFVCSPEEVPKDVTNYFGDGNLSNLWRSPRKHHSLINSKGNKKENLSSHFENKIACSRTTSTVDASLKDDIEPVNTKGPSAKLNEEEILVQLEDDSQVMDVQLEFNNSFKSKKQLGKQFEKIELLEDSFDFVPAKAEEPSYAYKGAVKRKKAEKHKVNGWECKDYFHSKGLSEEQKKAVLSKCSCHGSKFNHVTNTPKDFWNADWDSINERNVTQFENCHLQNEFSKTKKKESKASFPEFNEASSTDSGQKTINLIHQDISMSIDDTKKVKSTINQYFTDSEFDAIWSRHESIELGKVKKSRSKNSIKERNVTQFENSHPQNELSKTKKKESKASFPEFNEASSTDSGQNTINLNHQDISMSIDDKKKVKSTRNHNFTNSRFDAIWSIHESIELGKVNKSRLKNSINERNVTQFENSHPQNELSKTKKNESKTSYPEFNEASSTDSGQKTINLNHQDISMSIDDKKKVKSTRNQYFTDSEFDAIWSRHESIELGKVKKIRSKNSINERNVTQFENSYPQNEFSKTKKKESKASFPEFNEASSTDNGQNTINLNHQDISMSIDDKKKVKSTGNHNFTNSEFDALWSRHESIELGKVEKSRSKNIDMKSGKKACPPLKLGSKAPSAGCWEDTPIEDVSTTKAEVKKTKMKRKHQFTDMEIENLGVLLEHKKSRKEKGNYSKEQELVGKENNKEKKGKKKKSINMSKLNIDTSQNSLINDEKKKIKNEKKKIVKEKFQYSKNEWWRIYV